MFAPALVPAAALLVALVLILTSPTSWRRPPDVEHHDTEEHRP